MFATSVRVRPCSARCGPRSVGRVDRDDAVVDARRVISCGTACSSVALRALHAPRARRDRRLDAGGHGDGLSSDAAHCRLPDEAEHLAADAALCGLAAGDHADGGGQDRGAEAAEHLRQAVGLWRTRDGPGFEMRLMPGITRSRSSAYFSVTTSTSKASRRLPRRRPRCSPRRCRMRAISTLSLEVGIATRLVPRQVRVADTGQHVGDGIGQHRRLLPARLRHAGDDALVRELAQADAAHAELAEDRARPPAAAAAV